MNDTSPPKGLSTRDLRPLTEWFSTEDGQQTFSRCTFGFITDEHHVYFGRVSIRKYDLTPEIINESLKYVPDHEVYPDPPQNITISSVSTSNKTFIKGPTLPLYDTLAGTGFLPKLLLQEAETFDLMLHHGYHKNIVPYHGCLVKRGRIMGIVLARLPHLLEYRFQDSARYFDSEPCIRKIQSAVDFIHSLGLAHNDLKPNNIMLDEHDEPFIIDMGSCKPFGSLLLTAGTPGWVDEDYTHSAQWNDEIALGKIRAWLREKCTNQTDRASV